MAIKMRVLHTGKGKVAALAPMIHQEFQLDINATDVIPPAYSCNNERLVILLIATKGDLDNQVRLFCRELTKARAQNVALVIDGTEAGAKYVKEVLAEAGANVKDEVFYVKSSFLPFLNAIKPEEKAAALAWAHRIVDNL
ncbi:MAG: hypothetical protein J6B09_04405 [Clostridia bacterium]|nr:hypothetical protein [Clostridia bacterium]MBQ8717393.1 hypothetical protein [Clostridia bacterium]